MEFWDQVEFLGANVKSELPWNQNAHETKPFPCTVKGCTKSYLSQCALNQHTKTHSDIREKFPCTVKGCTKSYLSQQALNQHTKTHSGIREKFPCTVEGCTKSYLSQRALNKHFKAHSGIREKVPCTVEGCTKSYLSQRALNQHIRIWDYSAGCTLEKSKFNENVDNEVKLLQEAIEKKMKEPEDKTKCTPLGLTIEALTSYFSIVEAKDQPAAAINGFLEHVRGLGGHLADYTTNLPRWVFMNFHSYSVFRVFGWQGCFYRGGFGQRLQEPVPSGGCPSACKQRSVLAPRVHRRRVGDYRL